MKNSFVITTLVMSLLFSSFTALANEKSNQLESIANKVVQNKVKKIEKLQREVEEAETAVIEMEVAAKLAYERGNVNNYQAAAGAGAYLAIAGAICTFINFELVNKYYRGLGSYTLYSATAASAIIASLSIMKLTQQEYYQLNDELETQKYKLELLKQKLNNELN